MVSSYFALQMRYRFSQWVFSAPSIQIDQQLHTTVPGAGFFYKNCFWGKVVLELDHKAVLRHDQIKFTSHNSTFFHHLKSSVCQYRQHLGTSLVCLHLFPTFQPALYFLLLSRYRYIRIFSRVVLGIWFVAS